MAVIRKKIRLAGSKGQKEIIAIFDSGATYSCIQPDLAEELGTVDSLPEPMDFGTAKENERLTATRRISLNLYIQGYRFTDEFMVIPGLFSEAIIGSATLQKWRLKLDFEKEEVVIDPSVTELLLIHVGLLPGDGEEFFGGGEEEKKGRGAVPRAHHNGFRRPGP